MLYRFLDLNNQPRRGYAGGTLVDRDGRIRRITSIQATSSAPLHRPPGATATYPLRWRLRLPAAHLDITLKTLARNQFIRNPGPPAP